MNEPLGHLSRQSRHLAGAVARARCDFKRGYLSQISVHRNWVKDEPNSLLARLTEHILHHIGPLNFSQWFTVSDMVLQEMNDSFFFYHSGYSRLSAEQITHLSFGI